jgi:tetratricopeptide (TPR) repeat protein
MISHFSGAIFGRVQLAISSASIAILAPNAAIAQDDAGASALQRGDGSGAELAFDAVLQNAPNDVTALNGRGIARAWQKKWSGSIADFTRALELSPDNLEALSGLGYVYAWSGDTKNAETVFTRALAVAPSNLGVRKGLALTALWGGQHDLAITRFAKLSAEYPEDPEPLVFTGQAQANRGNVRDAVKTHKATLARFPDRKDAQQSLIAAYDAPALAELSVWGGTTSDGGKAGLRQVGLASWVTPRTQLWARYDNGLSLDNPTLARTGASAKTYQFGAQQQLATNVLLSGQVGFLDLPAGQSQTAYKAEAVYISKLGATKIGGQISPHSLGYTDTLFYGGHNFKATPNLSFEPTLYYATTGASKDKEWRLVGYGEYRTDNWSLGVGAGGGRISSINPAARGSVKTIFGLGSVRIAGWHRLNLSVAHEDFPTGQFTRVLVGMTLRLGRN